MPNKLWKVAERRLADFMFRVKRRPLSGSNSRSGGDDDIMHDTMYAEVKYLELGHPIWSLFLAVKRDADAVGKTPMLGNFRKGQSSFLLTLLSTDFERIAIEYFKARGMVVIPEIALPPEKE